MVSDGFTGNIILKLYEGVATALLGMVKGVMMSSLKTKIGAALIKKDMYGLKSKMDYNEYGGAPFVGVRKPVFKAHGSSKAKTFCNAIGQLKTYIEADVVGEIARAMDIGAAQETAE